MIVPDDRSDREVKCRTAGNIGNDLTIDCGIHLCGQIRNGVAFRFDQRGSWILDYDDLKAAYELATKVREQWQPQSPDIPSGAPKENG